MKNNPILVAGEWRAADAVDEFRPFNPSTGEHLDAVYPVSSWQDCDAALNAAASAQVQLRQLSRDTLGDFLEAFASEIEKARAKLVEMAALETGLAPSPRLADVEIPRTTMQLRQAAQACRQASWCQATIDSQNNIRSVLQAIGPVAVFGPNNFPFAFGSISGGDFAAAIAAGNPVIAKAHPSHPGTTRLLAELAHRASEQCGLPVGTIQMIYAMSNESGLKLVSDARIGATAFTGSRAAGLALKTAADGTGKPIYLELSSLNPVILLPGALAERAEAIVDEFTTSCVVAAGQLCTKPGLMVVPTGFVGDKFVAQVAAKFDQAAVGTLLSPHGAGQILQISSDLVAAGAQLLTASVAQPGQTENPARFCCANTLLEVSAAGFIAEADTFQREMFGNASLVIRSESVEQIAAVIAKLEGNLTGCIYSHSADEDEVDYQIIEPLLRAKVGRLLNDKMPTGVLVSSAMNHGGPYPASGHPGFSAVGMPGAIKRFAALKCFDNIRQSRLPDLLQDKNPGKDIWRYIDGRYTTEDVA